MIEGTKLIASATISGPEARGQATIRKIPSGELFLDLDNYWIAPGAPDVHVYLTPDHEGDVRIEGVVDFGRITQLGGSIQFPIPANANIATLKRIVVYCKRYSVHFGNGQLIKEG